MGGVLRAAGLLLGAFVAGCGCGEPPVPDAGRDAGEADSGRDASADGGWDAGRDGGIDAGSAPGWRRVEGLPEPCPVWVADDPSAVLPPLRFEPCPGRAEGCRQVVVDWPVLDEPSTLRPRFGLRRQHYVDGERTLFGYRRNSPPWQGDYEYYVVAASSGEHLAVVRTLPPTREQLESPIDWCGATSIAPGPDGYVFMVSEIREGTNSYIARARYDDPGAVERLWEPPESTTRSAEIADTSYEVTAVTALFPEEALYLTGSEAVTVCPAGPGTPYCTIGGVVEQHMIMSANDESGWRVVVAGPGDATFQDLIDTPDADDRVPRADGEHIVWMHGVYPYVGGRPSRTELWASPYATEPGGVAPRFINRLNVRGPNAGIGVGNGWAWTLEREAALDTSDVISVFHDLATGERRIFHYPAREKPMEAVYLGRDEVGIGVLPFDSFQDAKTLRFIRYDSLPVEPAP